MEQGIGYCAELGWSIKSLTQVIQSLLHAKVAIATAAEVWSFKDVCREFIGHLTHVSFKLNLAKNGSHLKINEFIMWGLQYSHLNQNYPDLMTFKTYAVYTSDALWYRSFKLILQSDI